MGSASSEPSRSSEDVYNEASATGHSASRESASSRPRGTRAGRWLSVTIVWSVVCFFLYSAWNIPKAPTGPFGVSFLHIALEASACTLLFRRFLGSSLLTHRIPLSAFFALLAALSLSRLIFAINSNSLNNPQLFSLWGSGAICLLMLGLTLDYKASTARNLNRFAPLVDAGIAAALLTIALVLRLQGPITAAVDEIIIYSEMLSLQRFPDIKFWDTSTTSNPFFVHWLVYLTASRLKNVIDSFVLEKFVTALFASLSIPIWYFAVKLLCNRRIALTAAVLLSVFGWHWVNSRFIYVYPYELTVISLATLCSLLAFGSGSFAAAAGLGLLWTFAILAKKISIIGIPFSAYLFLDFLVVRPPTTRKRILSAFLLCATVFLLTYLPFLYADGSLSTHISGSDRFFRYNQASEARQMRLAAMGLSPIGAYLHISLDAIHQLFVASSDAFRHYFRPSGPLLDPVLAVLSIIGFGYALTFSVWKRECRIAIAGLVMFTLPMILSFPLDSLEPHGIARRMVGNTFFIVLLGAMGADLISRLVARYLPRWIIPGVVCIASAMANFHFYKTEYLTQRSTVWFTDHGLRRAAVVLAARSAAQQGIAVLVLNDPTYDSPEGMLDLPNVRFLASRQELRKAISETKGAKALVIIPGPSDEYNFPVDELARDFSDLVPTYLWTPGRKSPRGYPLIVTATIESRT